MNKMEPYEIIYHSNFLRMHNKLFAKSIKLKNCYLKRNRHKIWSIGYYNSKINQKPSEILGKFLGINIYGHWILPNSSLDIFKFLRNNKINEINEFFLNHIYYKLIQLNPKLREIKLNYYKAKYDIIFGVISNFNFEDIRYFVVNRFSRNKELNNKVEKLEQKSHFKFSWILSEYTYNILNNYFKREGKFV